MKSSNKIVLIFVALWAYNTHALVLDPESSKVGRIIAGDSISINKAPYLVSLRYKRNASSPFEHRCSGTIYSSRVVLTTATCVVGVAERNLHIVAGTSYRTHNDGAYVLPVENFTVHPDFNIWFTDNDLAVVRLGVDLPLDKNKVIAPIALVSAQPKAGKKATIAGWGSTAEGAEHSEYLQMAMVAIVADAVCKASYGETRITAGMLCASGNLDELSGGYADSCNGDAGSPLVIDNEYAVGLASWGSGCGRENRPGVYTNLINFKQWIEQQASSV